MVLLVKVLRVMLMVGLMVRLEGGRRYLCVLEVQVIAIDEQTTHPH
jgi:hypothetical protein